MSVKQEVTNPETGDRLSHYEWCDWMWCVPESTVAGSYDTVERMVTCPKCGGEL